MGFTTDGDGWKFSFSDPMSKPKLPEEPSMATGYLAGKGRWENWSDPMIYECDCLVRQLFESKKGDKEWNKPNGRNRRFTFGMMFEVLFGRKYDSKKDAKYTNRLSKILAYYSSRVQTSGSIHGKRYAKPIYTLSPARYARKPPYSLKLRLEWLEERGELPTWSNMAPAPDDLKPGHARDVKTEENMERRRERARKAYNERYVDRKH